MRMHLGSALLLCLAIGGFILAQSAKKSGVQQQPFGTREGRPVTLYTLTNSHGVEVRAMNYGGIIVSIRVPDRKGELADIVLGHDTMEGYVPNPPFLGAIVGLGVDVGPGVGDRLERLVGALEVTRRFLRCAQRRFQFARVGWH